MDWKTPIEKSVTENGWEWRRVVGEARSKPWDIDGASVRAPANKQTGQSYAHTFTHTLRHTP